MASSNDAPESEPIDVEFTPAEPSESKSKSKSTGPGWVGLISMGVLAALGGGAIGVVASGTDGRYAQAAEVAVDISQLESSDRAMSAQMSTMRDSLRDAEVRINQAIEQIESGETANTETLTELQSELETLRARYLTLIGYETAPAEPGETQAEGEGEQAEGESQSPEVPQELPEPEITLATLMQRLNSIEETGAGNGSVPQGLRRAVTNLQQRAEQLEAADQQLADAMDARSALIEELDQEVQALEAGLTTVSEKTTALESGQESGAQSVTDLTADVNALRETVNERLSNLQDAELSADEQSLVRRADRVLALSALESAIRDGGGYAAELEALAIQMNANSAVSALRRLAEDGAPTIEDLQSNLEELRPAVARAGIPDQPKGNWAWVGDLLSGVVSMREEGTANGQTVSQKVQNAIETMEQGDLRGAIRLVKSIQGPQAEPLKSWIAQAESRETINRLIVRLRSDVMKGEPER